jgi:arylsulfatase A-like enzyme/tetratricopeptide (TPR) repeat protein
MTSGNRVPYVAVLFLAVLLLAAGTVSPGAASQKSQTPSSNENARETKTPVDGKVQEPDAARPNVVLITIDTLRADHVGCYGAQNVKTPTLDSLARDGVVFERAIAQVPLTWPSHAVILTGTYPFQNGAQDFTRPSLSPKVRSVAQAFQQAGFATGAVVSSFVLDRSWRLNPGFDFYDDSLSSSSAKLQKTDSGGMVARRAAESVPRAIAWLKRTQPRPFFLWLHLYDPHRPYDPPEPYRTEYKGHLYDGEIAYVDHELGALISWLKENRLYDSSLIVMLSDHGESLGEHGETEHGFFLYNATVHVPLIVKPPAGSGIAPGRSSEVVETAAVAPTLLKLAGIQDDIQKDFQAPALLSANSGRDPAYSETTYPFSLFGWSPLHGLQNERYHFIETPKPELYDLVSDPGETKNIADEKPAVVGVMREKLQKLLEKHPFEEPAGGTGSLTPEAQEKLRALGYFGFRAPVSPEALKHGLADPKDKLWEFNTIMKSEDAFQQKRGDEGEALLLQVQKKDPNIALVAFLLGETALRQKNWDRAARQLQRCLELNPEFDSAMTALARALAPLGRTSEAKAWLKKALEINPQNYTAWYLMGLFEPEDSAAAQKDYEKAIAIQPGFMPAQRELGMALLHRREYASAAVHLEKAVALERGDAQLHNYLGMCYVKTQRAVQAVKEHQRAIELDPNLAEAHMNLAFDYQQLGKLPAAKAEYDEACRLNRQLCQGAPAQRK